MKNTYAVRPFDGPIDIQVTVPGSKSITNRALLLGALARGESVLNGVGMSDDSKVFMEALTELGFDIVTSHKNNGAVSVKISGTGGDIPVKSARVYVGAAGTAARFLTAMLALSDGCYVVDAAEQMKKRPIRELIEALETMGAFFEFTEESYAFPFTVYGKKYPDNPQKNRDRQNESSSDEKSDAPNKSITNENNTGIIPLNIDRSSQFLSALLLCGPMVEEGFRVKLTGKRQARSYVEITEKMMTEFGYKADETGIKTGDEDVYEILPDRGYEGREYDVEPDVSAACYFYALAAINGGKACVEGVHPDSTQGDLKFLDILEKMGCKVYDEKAGMIVEKEPENKLHGIEINMSDFSDQTMTIAAIAPFAESPVKVTGVSHIRGQESDRISAIVTELNRIGVRVEEYEDGFKVWPYESDRVSNSDYGATLTYNDHRMAMSFATLGTSIDGVVIDNPGCCAKTFEDFFDVLDSLYQK